MIINLATYKSLTGTTVATDDTYLSATIPAVCQLVEAYCDRHFDVSNYSKWINYNFGTELILDEYPINKVNMIGSQVEVANLSWDTTLHDYAVEVRSDRITITNTKDYGSPSSDHLYSDNHTLAELKIDIEDDYDITVAIESGYTTLNTQLLKSGNGQTWYGAKRTECDYRIQDFSLRFIAEEDVLSGVFYSDLWFSNSMYLAYNAGYAYADMPVGLQLVVSNIVKDLLSVKNLGGKGIMKSESVTNYSYTNWAPSEYDIKNLIHNYEWNLEPYKKKSI